MEIVYEGSKFVEKIFFILKLFKKNPNENKNV